MKFLDLNTDVFAIKCIKNHVFLGIGCTLYVVNSRDEKVETKIDALHPDNIHNISTKFNKRLIVYGGKRLCIFQIDIEDNLLNIEKLSEVHVFDDWIIDVKWLGSLDDPTLTILFAHNNIYNYHVYKKTHYSIACKETCLLYAGLIEGKSHENAVVFSGTVFQEILIWKFNKSLNHEFSDILYRLKGHKGVLTSIFYSQPDNLIFSASDDRTVRLWKVSDDIFSHQKLEISLQTTMYGHLARVWKATLFKNTIISIGEDSYICFWNLCGELIHKIKAHQGVPIWCLDISDENVIYTGGSDGSVNSWALASIKSSNKNFVSICDNKENIPKHVIFLDKEDILVLTNSKSLSKLLHFHGNDYKSLNYYDLHEDSIYYIMELSPDKKNIALASIQGDILIYGKVEGTWTQMGTHKIADSKIFSLQWLDTNTILISLKEGLLYVLKFLINDIEIFSRHVLPYSRERWTTAGCLHHNILICGDRMGSIHIFDVNNDSINPIHSFNKIHGRLGVQLCKVMHSNIITAGRDGTLKYFNIKNPHAKKSSVEFMYTKSLPMDWICRISQHQNDHLVLGFREENFVIYSIFLKRILAKIPCGGGHRSWDCIINDKSVKFVYIQKKQVNFTFVPLETLLIPQLLTGFCSKEIYSIKLVPNLTRNCYLLISGGEDCSLRIHFINQFTSKPELKIIDSFDGHLSSIKCLSIYPLNVDKTFNKVLIFSAGGRAQIKVWEVALRKNLEIFQKDDLSCKDLLSHMLYGPDEKRSKIWIGKELQYHADPETRYMDLSTIENPLKPENVLIFIACSDGYIRTFDYNFTKNTIHLVNTLAYKNRCILKVHSFLHKNKMVLMTMATDGFIVFWNVDVFDQELRIQLLKIDGKDGFMLHKSGINSFDMKNWNEDEYILVTGGDDNVLKMTLFKINLKKNDLESIDIVSVFESSSAHCAQITGLELSTENKLYSVGADQKIVLHKYSCENSNVSLTFLEEQILCLPDIQGITFLENTGSTTLFCVYGKGIQLLQK